MQQGEGVKLAIIAELPPEGAPESEHALRLSEALAACGAEVHALAGRSSQSLERPALTVHPLMRDWTWRDLPRLLSFLRRTKPDALLLHYLGFVYHEHPMVTLAPGLAHWLRPGTRTVTCLTNCSGSSLLGWLRPAGVRPRKLPTGEEAVRLPRQPADVPGDGRLPRLMRALTLGRIDGRFGSILSASDRIVVLSEVHRAAFAAYEPRAAGKLVVIPPGPVIRTAPPLDAGARRKCREGLGAAPEDFVFIYFGFIYSGKGLDTLLRAFRLLAARRPGVRLVMAGGVNPVIGPGHLEAMRALAGELGIAERVAWTGGFPWDSPEPSEWLQAADACVLPFDSGLQLNNSSFAAAAAHGLPVVSTRGAGVEPPFVDGENVRLCPPAQPEALAAAMQELVDDPGLRARLGSAALKLAEGPLSWKSIAGRFMELLTGG
jgi:glycosyltransferase involved in cell wall biosynthesis